MCEIGLVEKGGKEEEEEEDEVGARKHFPHPNCRGCTNKPTDCALGFRGGGRFCAGVCTTVVSRRGKEEEGKKIHLSPADFFLCPLRIREKKGKRGEKEFHVVENTSSVFPDT